MKLSVYKQMTESPANLFAVLNQEIGIKSNCTPFAKKAMKALSTLDIKTEAEGIKAANTFLSDLQTLNQGGVTAEDHDKIDFVKRGNVITVSARVEAFLRAAGRKGYRITDTIVAVPQDDAATTYFKENFYNGEIVYALEDARQNPDRAITAERLTSGYFAKFICRFEVFDINQSKRIAMTTCEMSNDELLSVAAVSEQGLYKSRWEKYIDNWGREKNRKVITKELNAGTFWVKWTSEMVEKTIIRRALKRIKEVLPELKETIYAFDRDDSAELPPEEKAIEIPMETVNVDLANLTEQQKADCREVQDLFKANPKLAIDSANEVKALLDAGESLQSIVNAHYASITCIKLRKKVYPIIQPYFEKVGGKSE